MTSNTKIGKWVGLTNDNRHILLTSDAELVYRNTVKLIADITTNPLLQFLGIDALEVGLKMHEKTGEYQFFQLTSGSNGEPNWESVERRVTLRGQEGQFEVIEDIDPRATDETLWRRKLPDGGPGTIHKF